MNGLIIFLEFILFCFTTGTSLVILDCAFLYLTIETVYVYCKIKSPLLSHQTKCEVVFSFRYVLPVPFSHIKRETDGSGEADRIH